MLLERFPLSHQVTYFPHKRLMAIDSLFGGLAVVIELWRRHGGLELLHLSFALGDARFEIFDTRLKGSDLPILRPAFCIEVFPRVSRRGGC